MKEVKNHEVQAKIGSPLSYLIHIVYPINFYIQIGKEQVHFNPEDMKINAESRK